MILKKKCYYCTNGKINDKSKKTNKRIKKLITCPICNGTGYYNEEIDVEKLTEQLNQLKTIPKDNRIEIIDNSKPLTLYFDRIHNTTLIEPEELLFPKYDEYIFAIIKEQKYTLVHIPTTLKIFMNVSKEFIYKHINSYPIEIIEKSWLINKYSEFFKSDLIKYIKQSYKEYLQIKGD